MNQYCYINGETVLLAEAKVSVLDIGLLRGFSIYDGLTAYGQNIFHFADHWERFVNGAHALGLNIPVTEDKCEKIIKDLLQKNGFERSIIRIILTGGSTIGGIEFNFETPTFYIVVEKWTPLSAELYEKGGRLVTYCYKRETPEVKTTNYIKAVTLQQFKKEEKAIEILFTSDGEIFECSTSNIFLVKNGVLITPSEEVLGGITRKVVLALARENNIALEERRVEESELQTADEVFITSSFKDIVPIVDIDEFKIGNGEVGLLTRTLIEKFKELTK